MNLRNILAYYLPITGAMQQTLLFLGFIVQVIN